MSVPAAPSQPSPKNSISTTQQSSIQQIFEKDRTLDRNVSSSSAGSSLNSLKSKRSREFSEFDCFGKKFKSTHSTMDSQKPLDQPRHFQILPNSEKSNWEGFDRQHVLSLLLQTLDILGMNTSREVLELESSVQLETPEIARIHKEVLEGKWGDALKTLTSINISNYERKWCEFLILEQKYLELLQQGQPQQALLLLRSTITNLSKFCTATRKRARTLCSLLMLRDEKSLLTEAGWSPQTNRISLWIQINHILPLHLSPQPYRLATLLHQAVRYQELFCQNHGALTDVITPGLLKDHSCHSNLPRFPAASLEGHTDEVWWVCISNSAKHIASGSKDESIIIWDVDFPNVRFVRRYSDNDDAISSLSWNEDDRFLLSSTITGEVNIWDISAESANPFHRFYSDGDSPTSRRGRRHTNPCLSVGLWVPQKSTELVVTASHRRVIYYSLDPSQGSSDSKSSLIELNSWVFRKAIQDIAVNSTHLFVSLSDKTIRSFVLDADGDTNSQFVIEEFDNISSLCVSKLLPQFLVGVAEDSPVIRLWDMPTGRMLQRYRGHQQGHYFLKASFGGAEENFVVSGSEDAKVYVWNRLFGSLLATISGHSSTVNFVDWPMTVPWMATASDDQKIILWHNCDSRGVVTQPDTNSHTRV